jgi:biopolymer transport protein ExbD
MPLKTMRDDPPAINMAPMIDIVFLLIIFFMVGSRFTEMNDQERDVAVRVPQVSSLPASAAAPRKHVINVLSSGQIQLNGETVLLAELEQRLRQHHEQNPNTSVVIRGDSNSVYQSVADVIAMCRRVDIRDVSLAIRVAELRQ